MTTETFFLKDIRSEDCRHDLSPEEQAALDEYLKEMGHGPADGDMDIEWQESGRGYYAHLHVLESIKDEQERANYCKKLREDIDAWLSEEPNHYMVEQVREMVFGVR